MNSQLDHHEKSNVPDQLASIAELLTAVGSMLAGWEERHYGGPGATRRAKSIALPLLPMFIAPLDRRDIAAMGQGWATAEPRLRRHMARPPAGWSAP